MVKRLQFRFTFGGRNSKDERSYFSEKRFQYTNDPRWKSYRLGHAFRKRAAIADFQPAGVAGHWTPQDMFVVSVNACLMLTFLSFTEREYLAVTSYEGGVIFDLSVGRAVGGRFFDLFSIHLKET